MFPSLLKLGPITFHSYGLMLALGFLLALYLSQREAKRNGIDPEIVATLGFWILILGLVGTRLLHIIMFSNQYSWRDPIGWIAIWRGGLVFQGALPPALVFAFLYMRKKGLPFWKTSDLLIPYAPLAHAVGRMGCFLNGCCYGARTNSPWGICFPRVPWDTSVPPTGSPAYLDHVGPPYAEHWSYAVHPTQLYEGFGLVVIALLLLLIRERARIFDGVVVCAYLALYGILRFFLEFLRGDHNPTHFGTLSDQQIISILLAVVGAALMLVLPLFVKRSRAA
ncbi:MAG: prolipoprotein diacylglyceryl transferase [Candidatus Hydrogenedentes bacterium]|nr:prolipoprotein diacylglyceryl transferase [Candidatus Hydrogenedentota bacterium]